MTEARDYIPRTLSWTDAALKTQTVRDREIVSRFSQPIVILGDPGIGKTWLMEMLGEQDALQPFPHEFGRTGTVLPDAPKAIPDAALKDARLYELLALIDAIRTGNQREASLAERSFEERMA